MPAPARKVSFQLLCRITIEGAFSDYALRTPEVDRLSERDRNLATEIVYGTLRWQGWLDVALGRASSRPLHAIDPRLLVLLRMSVYQMARMDRIPDRAVVHDAVEIARADVGKGSDRFANAVLRRVAAERPWQSPGFEDSLPDAARVSLPEWLWRRWSARFGREAALAYARTLLEPPRRAVRSGEALPGFEPSDLVPGAWLEVPGAQRQRGPAAFQDEASQLIPYLFGDLAGRTVWDACAAPGGKSSTLASLAGPHGRVVASDLRLPRLAGAFDLLIADATAAPFRVRFDAVLADVPCSGLGTLRRNPEIKWRIAETDLERLSSLQGAIVRSVAQTVAPGGRLLYSTCSTEPEENEHVVEAFLRGEAGFRRLRPATPAGIEAWTDPAGSVRTFPSGHFWDGFFAALMVRES
jgi:16S rRNA (cytosine967-C5)-methyltransferase